MTDPAGVFDQDLTYFDHDQNKCGQEQKGQYLGLDFSEDEADRNRQRTSHGKALNKQRHEGKRGIKISFEDFQDQQTQHADKEDTK